jgi:hypothetical protein
LEDRGSWRGRLSSAVYRNISSTVRMGSSVSVGARGGRGEGSEEGGVCQEEEGRQGECVGV